MKNARATLLCFLSVLVSLNVFSQTTETDSTTLLYKLSGRIAKSAAFKDYEMQRQSISRITMQKPTEEARKQYMEERQKVKDNNTLSVKERDDSMQRMLYMLYGTPVASIDSFMNARQQIFNGFPELLRLSMMQVVHVLANANALSRPPSADDASDDKVFTRVEYPAVFPGGAQAWKSYLERNLDANVAAKDRAPAGLYPVKVQFIVDKVGNISNVMAIEVPAGCPHCGQEAVKVISKGPKWQPAVQNGRNVTYQAIQYITFQVAVK